MYYEIMKVTWDPEKAKINLRKHRIRFADAEPVFFDPMALTREDDDSEGEQRFVSLGIDALNRILVVVYTYRGADIRLISARRSTSKERKHYDKRI
ncbi:MAG: BrnT family toxin [Chlorobium sp.]|nr:BrnT family toxin [Chlorobium sp.]